MALLALFTNCVLQIPNMSNVPLWSARRSAIHNHFADRNFEKMSKIMAVTGQQPEPAENTAFEEEDISETATEPWNPTYFERKVYLLL